MQPKYILRHATICSALIAVGLTYSSSSCADQPLLDWFGGKLGLTSKTATTTSKSPSSAQAPVNEPVNTGLVPPADGRAWVQMATSPDGGAIDLVLTAIDSAKISIRIAAYSFTSRPIAQALIRKQKAGVNVMVVMDKSQLKEPYTSAKDLSNAGIPVRINSRYPIQHSKMLVIDADTVQTGSFNYSGEARHNSENVLVIWHHRALATQYNAYWQRLWEESEPFFKRP